MGRDRERDRGRNAARFECPGVVHPGVKVFATMARRGVDEAGARLVGDMVAVEERHFKVIATAKAMQRVCAGDRGKFRRRDIADELEGHLRLRGRLFCETLGEDQPFTGLQLHTRAA